MSFPVKEILPGVIFGAFFGGFAGYLGHVITEAKKDANSIKLEPYCELLETKYSNIADAYKHLIEMATTHKLAPEKNIPQIKKVLSKALLSTESILIIEQKVRAGGNDKLYKLKTNAMAFYKITMNDLRLLIPLYKKNIIDEISGRIEAISWMLMEVLENIENLLIHEPII